MEICWTVLLRYNGKGKRKVGKVMMTYVEKREWLKEDLLKMKALGYRVFISKSKDYAYGLIADKTNIVYVQFAELSNCYQLSYKYMPTKGWGSGCTYYGYQEGLTELTKAAFNKIVDYGCAVALNHGISMYASVDHFLKRGNNANFYEEL